MQPFFSMFLFEREKLSEATGRVGKFPCWVAHNTGAVRHYLSVLLLMTIFPKTLFALVRGNFMTFTFFSARHTAADEL